MEYEDLDDVPLERLIEAIKKRSNVAKVEVILWDEILDEEIENDYYAAV